MTRLRNVDWTFVWLAALVVSFGVNAQQNGDSEARRLVIGLDLSRSNPLVENPAYAQKLADRVATEIKRLGLRSEVLVRTFGDLDPALNTLSIQEVVSARNRPEAIAASVSTIVANVPRLVEDGKLSAQENTNIIAFIKTMHDAVGECKTPTAFILLTDGLEDSEYARLRDPGSTLPQIDIRPRIDRRYKCDELQILGLGQGLETQASIDRLRAAWAAWAVGDGPFETFLGLNDW